MNQCLLVGWLVCQQDSTNSTEQISMRLGWRMCLGPEKTPLTFGVDLNKGKDAGFLPHFQVSIFALKRSESDRGLSSLIVDDARLHAALV